MSDGPQGPGGTVFRPNPGLRLPDAPKPPAPEEWIASTPEQPAISRGVRMAVIQGGALTSPNENPIMGAAAPVLLLLGQLRVSMLRAPFAQLMELVANAIQDFEEALIKAGVPEGQLKAAKYILCASADDIVQHIPNEERHVWTQFSMLSRFFGERLGGQRFFEEVDRSKIDPIINHPLLELEHACLALGFQGKYRTQPGGVAILQQEQRTLYETLRRVRPRPSDELSPHWQGQQTIIEHRRPLVPIWAACAFAALAIFGAYAFLALERRAPTPPPPPPPPSPQSQTAASGLATDIAAGTIQLDETGDRIRLRIGSVALFASGEATVLETFRPVAARLVTVLQQHQGTIRVIGHTDSTPIRTVRFPSNWHLSVERAKAVAAILRPGLSAPGRLVVEGKGADEPIASNETPQGRAQNRRVEIIIAKDR
jgi:type VI secretion system protein ImpK